MIIVDASIIVKVFVAEDGSDLARSVLRTVDSLSGPSLLYAEVGNVLRKMLRGGRIDHDQYLAAINHLLGALDNAIPDVELLPTAADLALRLDHSVYDCFYLAASLQTGFPLLTADEVFVRKAEGAGYRELVISLLDWHLRGAQPILAMSPGIVALEETARRLFQKLVPSTSPLGFHAVPSEYGRMVKDSIAYRKIEATLQDLAHEERAQILTLAWIGRNSGPSNWPLLFDNALNLTGRSFKDNAAYIIPLMKFVGRGVERLGNMVDFEPPRFPNTD